MYSLYLFILLFLVLVILFFMIQWLIKWAQQTPKINTMDIKDCCVIIPVRNESDQLKKLFDAISKQIEYPGMLVFIDDHSDDDSREQIERFIEDKSNINLLHLNNENTGKKTAIRQAIEKYKYDYYLTMDADTYFEPDFFKNISNLNNSDMVIRPVIMESQQLFGSFVSAEYLFFNALNYALNPFYILSASGANLFFKAKTFHKADQFSKHKHIASGDDHYLLRDFQKKESIITMIVNQKSAIYTAAPNSFNAYLNQRIRWLGKTKKQTNLVELLFGLGISFYFVGIFAFSILLILTGDFKLFIVIFSLRIISDTIVFTPYLLKLKRLKHLLWIPFFQLIYPLLFLSTLLLSVFYTPKWKGR